MVGQGDYEKAYLMKPPKEPVTLDALYDLISKYLENCSVERDKYYLHKPCGTKIRVGYFDCFYLRENGTLDPGYDGFGIGPIKVPYCEKCDPPTGFRHSYAVRVPILRVHA